MWLEGGHAYVYLIYGMYNCINVVTEKAGCPEAVLIRALEPVEGLELMFLNRKVVKPRDLTSGPGKLCIALGIDRAHDGMALDSPELFIEDAGISVKPSNIVATKRVGVKYAGEAALWDYRFYLKNNPYVSKV